MSRSNFGAGIAEVKSGLNKCLSAVSGGLFSGHQGSRLYKLPDHSQRPRGSTPGDYSKAVDRWTWRMFLQFSRTLYARFGPLRSGIIEKANVSVVDGWLPQYFGDDAMWGKEAEGWLNEWFKVCDVRGQPFDFWTNLFCASIAMDRDGDFGLYLVDNGAGYPLIQVIPGHRIGTRTGEKAVSSGPYQGLAIENGVILNSFGRAVAYRILADDASADRDVSARDLMLCFDPDWFDMARGISAYAHAILDCFNLEDIRHYLQIQVKGDAILGITIENETGTADVTTKYFNDGTVPSADSEEATPIGVTMEELDGGAIRYFKAGTGSGLKALNPNRPGNNVPPFIDSIIRGALQGAGIPFEIYDSSKSGGAPMRVIVERFMKTVSRNQTRLYWLASRMTGYGLAKAAKLKLIPPLPVDWWKIDFTMPAKLTADAGNEAKIDQELFRIGGTTLREIIGKRGRWWEDEITQRIRERKFLEDECKRQGVSAENVQILTPNGNQPDGENTKEVDPKKQEQDE